MREDWGKGGGTLMSLALGAFVAYLITSRTTTPSPPAQVWPTWPYFFCGGMFLVGAMLYGSVNGKIPGLRRWAAMDVKVWPDPDQNRLRLIVTNNGRRAEFKADVISFTDQRGQMTGRAPWAVGRQAWPVPWEEGGSIAGKEILKHQGRTLDFAKVDHVAIEEDHHAGAPLGKPHWLFLSDPAPVLVTYMQPLDHLDKIRFLARIRITRVEPGGKADATVAVGLEGFDVICEVLDPWLIRTVKAARRAMLLWLMRIAARFLTWRHRRQHPPN